MPKKLDKIHAAIARHSKLKKPWAAAMATYKKSEAKRLGKVWVRLVRGKKTLESLLIARSKLKGIVADLDQCPCRVKGDLIKIYDPKTHNTLTLKWKR